MQTSLEWKGHINNHSNDETVCFTARGIQEFIQGKG